MAWPIWLSHRTRTRLSLALAVALALPWLIGQWLQVGLQPGLADDAERKALLVDFMVAGAMLTGVSLVVAYAVGCWVVAIMRGPVRHGDAFPSAREVPRDPR
jgi:Sec-independent protein secretion pathway component TatC